jgi:hypothetical protein
MSLELQNYGGMRNHVYHHFVKVATWYLLVAVRPQNVAKNSAAEFEALM